MNEHTKNIIEIANCSNDQKQLNHMHIRHTHTPCIISMEKILFKLMAIAAATGNHNNNRNEIFVKSIDTFSLYSRNANRICIIFNGRYIIHIIT